jgi:hypothetical protein
VITSFVLVQKQLLPPPSSLNPGFFHAIYSSEKCGYLSRARGDKLFQAKLFALKIRAPDALTLSVFFEA